MLPVADALSVEAEELKMQPTGLFSVDFTETNLSELRRFYSARDYRPVWLTPKQKLLPLNIALTFIATAEEEGLDSRDYQLQQLKQLELRVDETTDAWIELELRTTHALLTLIHDLHSGRLSASTVDPDWHIPQSPFDAVAFLLEAVTSDNLHQLLNELPPKKLSYQLLKQTLARYRELENNQLTQIHIPDAPVIHPDTTHALIPLIRRRMAQAYVIDGFAEYNITQSQSLHYNDELVAAIKAFQMQHGLNADGVIGKNTAQALNTALAWKIRQLRLNMERLRWLPRDLDERYLLVNIAGFRLTTVERGEHVLDMRIIVGRDYRSTPSFSSHVSHVILNPYWNVPASIARKDLLPKQKKDPTYFSREGIKIYSGYDYDAAALDPESIDWHAINKGFPYVLRQDPGAKNALGTIKFIFSNPFDIYLHDTPSKSLFQSDIRTFSSGCIRLEKPLLLAEFTLNEQNLLTQLISQIDSGKTSRINLPEPLPIYLVYITVWVDNSQRVHFSPDIYGRDERALNFAGW
ncbi:MAG: L,D-transpeptidase family protein [Nitrosomonas sp.]|nr:L,D-transpeptidase family protein [Nitrosomonas sp.]